MIPREEALYYLVREMGGLGIRAGEKHFEAALEHVRQDGLAGLRNIEIEALVEAAMLRNREKELDEAVEEGTAGEQLSLGVE